MTDLKDIKNEELRDDELSNVAGGNLGEFYFDTDSKAAKEGGVYFGEGEFIYVVNRYVGNDERVNILRRYYDGSTLSNIIASDRTIRKVSSYTYQGVTSYDSFTKANKPTDIVYISNLY